MFMEYERKQLLKSYYVFPFSIMMIETQRRETELHSEVFRQTLVMPPRPCALVSPSGCFHSVSDAGNIRNGSIPSQFLPSSSSLEFEGLVKPTSTAAPLPLRGTSFRLEF